MGLGHQKLRPIWNLSGPLENFYVHRTPVNRTGGGWRVGVQGQLDQTDPGPVGVRNFQEVH